MASVPDPEVVARVKLKWSDWVRIEMLSARWVDTNTGHVKRQKPRKAIDRTPPDPENAGRYILADPHRGDVRIITIGRMVDEVLGEWVNRDLTNTGTVDAFYRQFFSSRAGPRDEDVRKIIAWYKDIVEEVAKESREAAWKVDKRAARKPVEVAAIAASARKSKLVQTDSFAKVKKEGDTFGGMRKEGPNKPKSAAQGTLLNPTPRSRDFASHREENAIPKPPSRPGHQRRVQMARDDPTKLSRRVPITPVENGKKPLAVPLTNNNVTFASPTSINNRFSQENFVFSTGPLTKKADNQDFSVKPVSHNVPSQEKSTDDPIAKLSVHLHRQSAFPKIANAPVPVSKRSFNPQKPPVPKPTENPFSPALAIHTQPRVEPFQPHPHVGREPATSHRSKHNVKLENSGLSTPQKSWSGVQDKFPTNYTPPSGPRSTRIQRSDSIISEYKRRTQSPIKERFDVVERFRRDEHPSRENQNFTRAGARPLFPPAEHCDRRLHSSTDTYRPYYGPDNNTRHQGGEISHDRPERSRDRGCSLTGEDRHAGRYDRHNLSDYEGGLRRRGSRDDYRS